MKAVGETREELAVGIWEVEPGVGVACWCDGDWGQGVPGIEERRKTGLG